MSNKKAKNANEEAKSRQVENTKIIKCEKIYEIVLEDS